MHQPSVTDAATLRRYRQDLTVSKFLSGLSPTQWSQMRGQILGGDSIPTLTVTFSRVMWVFTGADISSAPFIKQSAMVSERGRDRDFRGWGHEFLDVDVARMEADRVPLRKVPSNAGTMDAVITFRRSAGRNLVDLSGHNYLSLILLLLVALFRTIHPLPLLFLDIPRLYWHRSMIDFDS